MKAYLCVLFLLIATSSCKKSNNTPAYQIKGKWELKRMYGGFPPTSIDYTSTAGYRMELNPDGTYRFYEQQKLTEQGTYQIKQKAINTGSSYVDELYFNYQSNGSRFTVKNDTLSIGSTIADGFVRVYARLK